MIIPVHNAGIIFFIMFEEIIKKSSAAKLFGGIVEKVMASERISASEGIMLYEKADLSLLAVLADQIRKKKNGDKVFYIRNLHIEPTNICVYNCRFCSFSRKQGEKGGWETDMEKMLHDIKNALVKGILEVHIVGGVHPERDHATKHPGGDRPFCDAH